MAKYFYTLLLSAGLLLACQKADAQHLSRKGFFGVAPAPVSGTVAEYLGLEAGTGVLVQKTFPGTTSEAIGLQEKDVILSVIGKAVNSPPELIAISRDLIAGDKLEILVNREGKKKKLKGTALPMAIPVPEGTEVVLDEYAWQEGHVRNMVMKPKGVGPFPVVYLIQGYTCDNAVEGPDFHPYKQAADILVQQGFAVYRVEKPGMGDNLNTPPCMEIDFTTEVDNFKKGYEKLLSYDWADKDRIFIWGHSLGGLIAPYVAEVHKPAGVISYGVGYQSWHDYLVSLIRYQTPLFHKDEDYATAEKKLADARAGMYAYFYEKKSPAEVLKEHPEARDLFTRHFHYDGNETIIQRHYTFWQDLNDYNFAAAWKGLSSPVLAIYGESDIAALNSMELRRLADLINSYHPGNGTFYLAEDTNHHMIKIDRETNVKVQLTPEYVNYLRNDFNGDLILYMSEWMKKQMGKS